MDFPAIWIFLFKDKPPLIYNDNTTSERMIKMICEEIYNKVILDDNKIFRSEYYTEEFKNGKHSMLCSYSSVVDLIYDLKKCYPELIVYRCHSDAVDFYGHRRPPIITLI